MFNSANGEKQLMSLINATVSHEMKNPTNSIQSQNLFQNQLCEQLQEVLNDEKIKSARKLRRKMKPIAKRYLNSLKIQNNSSKLLEFLINDLLDFA